MSQLALERRGKTEFASALKRVDIVLVLATVALAVFGVVTLYSATKVQLVHAGIDPRYYLERQAIYDVLGLVAMVVVAAVGYRRLVQVGPVVYVLLVLSLLAVLAVGRSTLGSQRWFQLGPFQLQPSAFASLGLVLALAAALRNREELRLRQLVLLLLAAAVPVLLVVKQPDLGSAILMLVVTMVLFVVGGIRGRHLLFLAVLGAASIFMMLHFGLLRSYQLNRLTGFLHQGCSNTATCQTYNLAQSKSAISAGGVHGQGLFKGLATDLGYVPEQTTDFIFTAVGEQMGFVGATALIGLYALIAWRLWRQAVLAGDKAGRLCCAGALALIGYSVFQNIGMTMGIMPIAGIPLPLVSYGGSAVVDTFAAVGLALSVGLARSR